jgi:hypothetical protein
MVRQITGPAQAHILATVTNFARKSLLPNLLMTPEAFLKHIRKYGVILLYLLCGIQLVFLSTSGVGGSILSLAYGLPIKRVNDPWIALAEAGMHCLTAAAVPGKYAVDVIPALKYLPEWFPGAGFQKEAREWKATFTRMFEEPFKYVKKTMVGALFATAPAQNLTCPTRWKALRNLPFFYEAWRT